MPPIDAALARIQHWDERLSLRANRALRHAPVGQVLAAVSRLGDGILWYALMLGLLTLDPVREAPAVLHMLIVGIACTAIYKMLKRGTLRPRPYEVLDSIRPGARTLDRFSFPSGHTLHAVAFSIVACAHHPGLYWILFPFALLTGISRTVLGLHYPSDVLVGAAIGGAVALVSLKVVVP